jgi:hypothetical protein
MNLALFEWAPVVQWIEQRSPKPQMAVRICPGAPWFRTASYAESSLKFGYDLAHEARIQSDCYRSGLYLNQLFSFVFYLQLNGTRLPVRAC